MPTRPYHFFINPFLIVTLDSYKLMFLIGEDHFAKLTGLQADAEIAAILLTYDPVWQAYKGTDQNLESALGNYKGKTQTVEELFDKVTHQMLPEWEGNHTHGCQASRHQKVLLSSSYRPCYRFECRVGAAVARLARPSIYMLRIWTAV